MHEIENFLQPSIPVFMRAGTGRAGRQPASPVIERAAGRWRYALLIKVQSERKPPYRKRYARRACERHADLTGRCLCP